MRTAVVTIQAHRLKQRAHAIIHRNPHGSLVHICMALAANLVKGDITVMRDAHAELLRVACFGCPADLLFARWRAPHRAKEVELLGQLWPMFSATQETEHGR